MRDRKLRTLVSALMLLGIFGLTAGCGWTQTGELQEDSRTIELNNAGSVDADIRMGAGTLNVTGGAEALLEAEFAYNVPDWQPTLDYAVNSSGEGELLIEQPDVKNLGLESYRNEWTLAFNEDVPLDLSLRLGAGESELDVGRLSLRSLDVKMGVGGGTLDLTGRRDRDLNVVLRGGLGEATVLLPGEVGVIARVDGALGELDMAGMTRDGDTYVNQAYGDSEVTVSVDIAAGVGGLELRVVE